MKVGVIGAGNMGSALIKGWLRTPATAPAEAAGYTGVASSEIDLLVWDKVDAAVQRLLPLGPVSMAGSLEDLVAKSDVVLVVVKPKDAEEVLGAIARATGAGQIVVSAMAGLRLQWLRGILGAGPALFRIMPNLGVELGAGAVALASEPDVPPATVETVLALLRPLGLVEAVPEDLFDVVTAVSGSSPAFLAIAIEGLEDGAVAAGLSRQMARKVVRQAALATARLLPEYSHSPAELRENLALDSESDQAAMRLLEGRGVRLAFQRAVEAAMERSRQMRKA
jgi:pyrroline-5-carboxylate reductase